MSRNFIFAMGGKTMDERGVLQQDVNNYLDVTVDSATVENLIRVGARYIRKELERFNIYFEPGLTLEDIVLKSESPYKDLANITKLVYARIGRDQKAWITYGAIVAVYLAAHENRENVVPLKKLLEYYPYVKPTLMALTIFTDYSEIVEKYEKTVIYGHI